MSSAALAATVVAELVRQDVREAVLCPGSRNAPLAYALYRADAAGELRLHVRIDERSAGFLALGLAAASDRPVPVACTSGTAAANLHPAVLEAAHRSVPLLVLTADRPAELAGTGANQTTDQHGLFGPAVRWTVQLDSRSPAAGPATARAVSWATGVLSRDPGPVHLNLAFGEPLVGRADPVGAPGPMFAPTGQVDERRDGPEVEPRTLVVAGEGAARHAARIRATGWPVVAEPTAGLGQAALAHGVLLLGDENWLADHRPRRVVVVGHPTLHRATQRLLADPDVELVVVADGPRWPDAVRRAAHVVAPGWLGDVRVDVPAQVDERWRGQWVDASTRTAEAVASTVRWPSGLAAAREFVRALPPGAVVHLGSSNPVRDVDLAAVPRDDVRLVANRGLAGIDGTLSSAVGLALANPHAPAYALVGDLTFLHDLNGLLIGPREPRPDLTVVVLNDDGGGIFSTLEQGAGTDHDEFERLFGTPTGAGLAGLCAGVGAAHEVARTADDLASAVAERPRGIHVVEVPLDRTTVRADHLALRLGR